MQLFNYLRNIDGYSNLDMGKSLKYSYALVKISDKISHAQVKISDKIPHVWVKLSKINYLCLKFQI